MARILTFRSPYAQSARGTASKFSTEMPSNMVDDLLELFKTITSLRNDYEIIVNSLEALSKKMSGGTNDIVSALSVETPSDADATSSCPEKFPHNL
ncbi:hypothetical protein [Oryzifoliimicrobium ureilyticus]|uniref:hypothetical protein n=1 Tax=Oryzifoliimicrobium ureilyticus TaxID=3113724 RepID=UPI0030760E58